MAYDKVVDSAVLDGYFGDIADAIRDKGGSGTYTPAEMPQAIENLPSGGTDESLKAMIEGRATGDVTLNLPELARGVGFLLDYSYNGGLTSLTIAGCRELGALGFSPMDQGGLIITNSMPHLEQIYLPDCERLAIMKRSAYTPALTALKKFIAPKLRTLSIDQNPFQRCTKLEEVIMPCYGVTTSMLIGEKMFQACSALVTADLGEAWQINNNAFADCAVLTALVLRKSDRVCALSNTNALTNTPIAGGTGYVYVPRALISSYESATNWSTYAGRFRALEDYTDDGTLTGQFIHP